MKKNYKKNAVAQLDAKYQTQKEIAEGISKIKEQADNVSASAKNYIKLIDEAAMNGDDQFSDQLIEDKIELEELARNLNMIYTQAKARAMTAGVVDTLSSALPMVFEKCDALLNGSLDIGKLSKKSKEFITALDEAKVSIKNLTDQLFPKKDDRAVADIFGALSGPKVDAERQKKIQDEKAARDLRLRIPIEKKATGAVPSGVGEESSAGAGIDAISDLIDKETKK